MIAISSPMGAVILAAGSSSRMGQPKQLLRVGGKPLIRKTIEAFSEHPSIPLQVVTGSEHKEITDLLAQEAEDRVTVTFFSGHGEGMGSSLSFGVSEILRREPALRTILISVCDQPHLTTTVVNSLIQEHIKAPSERVACAYKSSIGVPACFPESDFSRLRTLKGEQGAKVILTDPSNRLNLIPFPLGSFDLDTPEDYAMANRYPQPRRSHANYP